MMQNYRGGLVLIESRSGRGGGSGFIAEIKGKKFMVSNAHVFAGIKDARCKLLDNSPLKLGSASVAVGHDLVTFTVVEGGTAIPVADSADTDAAINDGILVPGNAGGEDVVNALQGQRRHQVGAGRSQRAD